MGKDHASSINSSRGIDISANRECGIDFAAGYDPDAISEKQFYFYRDRDKKSIDFLIETIEGIYPIEIKKGVNPSNPDKNFDVLNKYGKKVFPGLVIDSGNKIIKLSDKAYAVLIELIGL